MTTKIASFPIKKFQYILLSLALATSMLAHAGVVVGGTRVVYDGSKRETALSVQNPDKDTPYLIQSWVESNGVRSNTKAPFIITPPLFRLDAGQENMLRIVHTDSGLPKNRESVYWLNVKSIPSTKQSAGNQLHISVKTRLKLFYRPAELKGNPEIAYQQIKFTSAGNTLIAHNPTSYFVSFYSLKVAGKEIDNPEMIAPLSQQHWTLPSSVSGKVSWQAINDYGAITREESITL
uniref:fimbrial biogenesis chaperone n=1 Tax=Serratia fonticola TaxID=47917 RepID=UPI0021AE1637|nr:molecular chaperone [Serratia fonticola]